MNRTMDNNLQVEKVEEAAAAWLLKRDSAQWSPDDEAELTEWLRASANHRVAYLRLKSVWQEASRLQAISAGFPQGQVPPRGAMAQSLFFKGLLKRKRGAAPREGQPVPAVPGRRRAVGWAFAAGILLAVLVATAAYWRPVSVPSYSTPVGGLASVPMADGSKITLNTNSEIELEVTDKERRVSLSRGEAFFNVAKDPGRPFIVTAGNKRIIAVGTQFSVRREADDIQVIVTEGRVRIERKAALRSAEPLANLVAGDIASADRTKVLVREKPLTDVEQTLSWRTGYVVLRKTPLAEAVAEFNRYNQRQLVIDDPSLTDITVGGNFRSSNIDGFVRLLQEGFRVEAEERDNRIALTRRRPAAR